MSAKKKQDPTTRYRVARVFTHGGRMVTHAGQLGGMSTAALEDRVKRGYIEDRAPAASEPAPAAKAKE